MKGPTHSGRRTHEQRLSSPLGTQRLVERQTNIEGPFALAKDLHGMRQTRFRGRRRVQIQVWLTAATMNIKKAVRNMVASPKARGTPLLPTCLRSLLSFCSSHQSRLAHA
jgi:hypothetical protein